MESCPNGYPRLAAFQASDDAFSLYRGFGYLHSRIILGLQAEITALEEDLKAMDDWDWQQEGRRDYLKSRAKDLADVDEGGYEGSRPEILDKLRTKLIEYGKGVDLCRPRPAVSDSSSDDMLIRARDLRAFQRPSKRDYRSVRGFYCSKAPLLESEADCIKHKEDMVTLRQGREWSGFDGFVETTLRKTDCKLIRVSYSQPLG